MGRYRGREGERKRGGEKWEDEEEEAQEEEETGMTFDHSDLHWTEPPLTAGG